MLHRACYIELVTWNMLRRACYIDHATYSLLHVTYNMHVRGGRYLVDVELAEAGVKLSARILLLED